MAMFLLHIALLLALALVAAGLVLWHLGKQPAAGVLRIGGAILVVGAVLSAVCIGYYGVRYHVQGDFDHAYAMHPPMDMGRMMGSGGMMERGGMMGARADGGSPDGSSGRRGRDGSTAGHVGVRARSAPSRSGCAPLIRVLD